jgi:hypothetical protein
MVSRRKLFLIEWVDSHSGDGWRPLDEIAGAAEPVYCRSVGWLVSRRNGTTVLVSHVSGEANGNIRLFGKGDIAIPNRAIRKMTCLRSG